jgi:hypothetical protein
MKNVNKIEANLLANNAILAFNIIKNEKNEENLLEYSARLNKLAKKTDNQYLADLGTEANRRAKALTFDREMPAAANDSKIEHLARYAAVRACSIQGKMIGRVNGMFARYGYAQTALRLVSTARGNEMFHKMCGLGLVEFTAEYIVYTHMLDLVSMEVATHVTELLIDADVILEL